MRNLPQQDLEIILRFGRVNLLGNIGATLGVGAQVALVVSIDFDIGQLDMLAVSH